MQYRQGGLAAMQQLEGRTDEQLQGESKHRVAAKALLGARAAERYDPKEARRFFNEAMVGAHPQERPALRQMMKASMALAERRPDELREAVQKLGQEPPSSRQLLLLRFMGLVVPPPGSAVLLRVRGVLILLAIVFVLVAVGYGLAELAFLPFGGIGLLGGLLVAMLIVILALGVTALLGRRPQRKAKAARAGPPPGGG